MSDHSIIHRPRRRLIAALAAGASAALVSPALAQGTQRQIPTANEDLMQEHGLVGRVIVIYERAGELLRSGVDFDPALIGRAAQAIAGVIHGHHEVEEEEIVFPVVDRSREMNMLVEVLRGQHRAARTLTATIGNNATPQRMREAARRAELIKAMREFTTMYAPHGAYEDTVVYPAFRRLLGSSGYEKMSRRFAENERRMHGEQAFAEHVAQLARIEKTLGATLAQYTRQVDPAVGATSR